MRTALPSWAVPGVLPVCLVLGGFGAPLKAQQIRIRALNARNGKPIAHECINVSLGSWHGTDILPATNRDGVAVLDLEGDEIRTEAACAGRPARVRRPAGVDTLSVIGDYYVVCQEYGTVIPGEPAARGPLAELAPSYPIERILQSGISAANTCGKFRAQAKPGELILYMRPLSFLEKLRM
jgi:hypothetical protein